MLFQPPHILTDSEANTIRGKCLVGHASPVEQMQLIGHFDLVEMDLRSKLDNVADILDELYAPIARSIDGGAKVNQDDVGPMQTCMAKLIGVWFDLRPGSSNVGIVRAAAQARKAKG